jgi:DNA-binding NtrC family response regulator
LKVLILEDDDLVAHGLMRGLGYLGHESVHLRRVPEAQSLVRDRPDIEVALIDMGLDDGESGEDFLRWLNREHPAIKRVLISGLARPPGFVDDPPRQLFLRKPFGQAQLASLLATLQSVTARDR